MPRYRQGSAAARDLRHRMTPAEQILWAALRRRQLAGLYFRRQHPTGPYILDFFCASCGLVVELDGAVHETLHEYDEERTRYLTTYGYRVIRFANEAVVRDLPSVLARIEQAALAPHGRGAGRTRPVIAQRDP
jgi:very-short-patch-repair endonuclease